MISTTSGSLGGTNKRATTEVGEPAGENSVWYRWTAPSNGELLVPHRQDWLTIDVYTGTAIDASPASRLPAAVKLGAGTAVAGTTYQIRLTKNTRIGVYRWSGR